MRVSVAVPCYNGANFIGPTLESILAQTHPADEVLVVDDGSNDGSATIAQSYPVTLLQHPKNLGLAAARNTALHAAQGNVLLFIDVDALAAPDLIAVLLTGYEVGAAALAGVGGQGIESHIYSLADRWRRAHASQGHGVTCRYVSHLFGLCMSYRVEMLHSVGGFNEVFRTNAEDVDIGLRLNAAGYRLLYLPGAKVFHQRADDQDTLKRAMAAWYRAAYRAKRRNNARPWALFAGTLRRWVIDPITDVAVLRDPALAWLSLQLCGVKWRALWQARQTFARDEIEIASKSS